MQPIIDYKLLSFDITTQTKKVNKFINMFKTLNKTT